MKRLHCKRGQVWVETVIYTLIGLAIIGIVLAGAMPKINEKKDAIIIEQSINSLSEIDNAVYDIQRAPGNRRSIPLTIGAGSFIIDSTNDRLKWVLESSYAYSEPGLPVEIWDLNVTTTEISKDLYEVELLTEYPLDIRYNGEDVSDMVLTKASVPYNLIIENNGKVDGRILINVYVA